uniref:ABC transporter ATP-binding protein n=1 Tax=candidate division WOR-3 bacterium TaxID=2052148 RepID=A0A7C4GHI1_UNCW3
MKAQRGSLGLVYSFWRQRPWWIAGLVVGTLAATAISLAFPLVLRLIIDGIRQGVTPAVLVRHVLILAGFGLLRSVSEGVLPWNRGRINELFQWKVRNETFRHILGSGHSFAMRFPTGDVMERLDHDLTELMWFACSGIFRFFAAACTVVFAAAIMLRMNVLLTAVLIPALGFGALAWVRLGPSVVRRFVSWREKISEANNQLEAAFSGIRLVKSYSMESRMAERFRQTLADRIRESVETSRIQARLQVFYMGIAELGILLVLWVGGTLVVKQRLTLGQFVAFNAYALMFIGPMFDLGNLSVQGKRAQAAAGRISELSAHPPEVTPPARPIQPEPGVLRLERVTFGYGGRPVLKDVTMEFAAGRRVGIAGTVGAGKSTVFRLLFRLADPQAGKLTLNGLDVRSFDLAAYRRLFGYAPQEPMLFSDTIRNNIAVGREVEPARLQRAVVAAQLDREVAGFDKGLDELLGERGTRLSGGQKGRVAIARAILEGPPVLVFDDATAALDAETERELVATLVAQQGERTAIVVSHRLAVLSVCDYIYCLDQGEVKEEGSPRELLERRGLYWRLYQRQLLEQELETL